MPAVGLGLNDDSVFCQRFKRGAFSQPNVIFREMESCILAARTANKCGALKRRWQRRLLDGVSRFDSCPMAERRKGDVKCPADLAQPVVRQTILLAEPSERRLPYLLIER